MKITFYVLNSNQQASSTQLEEDFLVFVGKLTQTVLEKSEQTLIILDDHPQRLIKLDNQLWTSSATSFIPHDLCLINAPTPNAEESFNQTFDNNTAPVILTDVLPSGFNGVVLNLANEPLNLANLSNNTSHADSTNAHSDTDAPVYDHPARLLEIIPADTINKQQGRAKYKQYRDMGYSLEVHNIG